MTKLKPKKHINKLITLEEGLLRRLRAKAEAKDMKLKPYIEQLLIKHDKEK